MSVNTIYQDRINATNDLIATNSEIQELIRDNLSYWNKIKGYSVMQLISEIQPKWNELRSLSKKEASEMSLLMLEYRLRGLDIEYFTHGAGSSGSCCIS